MAQPTNSSADHAPKVASDTLAKPLQVFSNHTALTHMLMQPEHSHLSQLGLIRTWSKIWRFEAAPLSSPAIWSMVCRMSRVGNSFNVFNQKAMSACKANMGSPVVSCTCSQVHFEGNQKRKPSLLRFPQENKRGMPQAGSVASLRGGRSLGG